MKSLYQECGVRAKPQHTKGPKHVLQGIAISPGIADGKIVLTANDAIEYSQKNLQSSFILVCERTAPEDEPGMRHAAGILTTAGDSSCHTAVFARTAGKPCVVGCKSVRIDAGNSEATFAGRKAKVGDFITITAPPGT